MLEWSGNVVRIVICHLYGYLPNMRVLSYQLEGEFFISFLHYMLFLILYSFFQRRREDRR